MVGLLIWCLGLPIWLLPPTIESESLGAKAYNSTFGSNWYKVVRPVVDYVVGGASYLLFAKVPKGEIWNYGNQTALTVRISFPPGTEIQRYDAVIQVFEREIHAEGGGVDKTTTRVLPEQAILFVQLSDSASKTSHPYLLKEQLTILAANTGGAAIGVYGFGPGFSVGLAGGGETFSVRVLGYNYLKVRDVADELRSRLERNPRIANVDIDRSLDRLEKSFELAVAVDRSAIAGYGLTVKDVILAVRSYAACETNHEVVTVDETRVPISVRFVGYRQYSIRDLMAATISNPLGNVVRLGSLVRFEQHQTPSEIRRENQEYVRIVSFNYLGPYAYGAIFLDKTLQEMPLPIGYRFDRELSWFELTDDKKLSLVLAALIALVIVFMVTSSLYESFATPFAIILAVPFSLIGLFLTFYFTDTPFGRRGYASVILLMGIVVTNGIVLVDHVRKQLRVEGARDDVLIKAASDRLLPVLMTTLATIAGLLPLLLADDKTSVWYSLALGTTGGLSSSTVLTLLAIPVLLRTRSFGLIIERK